MILESQAAFARRMNVTRSAVGKWKSRGRLIMTGHKVDVEASMELLEQTQGHRDDVRERHVLEHEERRALDEDAVELPDDPQELRDSLRRAALEKAKSEARIKKAEADMREWARDKEAGNLIAREDVEYVLRDFGATLRRELDGRADRLAAELGLEANAASLLAEADEQLLIDISNKLKRGV